jgi:hypothetical protein
MELMILIVVRLLGVYSALTRNLSIRMMLIMLQVDVDKDLLDVDEGDVEKFERALVKIIN